MADSMMQLIYFLGYGKDSKECQFWVVLTDVC